MGFVEVNARAIEKGFQGNPALQRRVYDAISSSPEYTGLFEDIAQYICAIQEGIGGKHNGAVAAGTQQAPPQQQQQRKQQQAPPENEGPAQKKRKIANGAGSVGGDSALVTDLYAETDLHMWMQDVSFTIPQRKKLRLELTRGGSSGVEYLRARNQASKEVEFGIPLSSIQHVLCLPVPEKAQRQFSYCIIPQYGDGITTAPEGTTTFEPMVWTVADAPPRTAFLGSGTPVMESASLAEKNQTYLQGVLDERLKGVKVTCPDAKEFSCAKPESHRKDEKAYHVKAFRGSKEGYLFFLSTGIVFGFKKPLIFFSFDTIESISYTSVLQRTFNLNIEARSITNPDELQHFEFSMLDQVDYPGIDNYVKKHRLQDASLAEQRRAKRLNVNGNEGDNEGEGAEGGESELQKAQRELETQEDDEEEEGEDYDPDGDDDSEGSGSSSEEEEEDTYDQGAGDDRDLVKEELGSEAEEVDED